MTLIEIKVSFHEEALALKVAKELVEKNYAACVHVSGPETSVFRWDSVVQTEQEWFLIAKTRESLFDRITDYITAAHPYDLPGITTSPIKTTEEFMRWVEAETTPE